jgi:hypothetical protein
VVKQPDFGVTQHTLLPDGTWQASPSNWTRESLKDFRKSHVASKIHTDPSILDGRPPLCFSNKQTWYDTHDWGYWYQPWHQVGNCFYCDNNDCNEAIQVSFSVQQTWTVGIGVTFDEIVEATFGFSSSQTASVSDTRTCNWAANTEYGCHSIWYQPQMSYHNGYANYQTHTHCTAASGEDATDYYHDHNLAFANVNQEAGNGHNTGNMGCNSGCSGADHRQCPNGNDGGTLWPPAN